VIVLFLHEYRLKQEEFAFRKLCSTTDQICLQERWKSCETYPERKMGLERTLA
jgi:hypothetical protein